MKFTEVYYKVALALLSKTGYIKISYFMQNLNGIENERLLYKTCLYDCFDFLMSMVWFKIQRLLSGVMLVIGLK